MPRSTKKRVKKEVKEEKIDEEKLDVIRYLGEDMALLSDQFKAVAAATTVSGGGSGNITSSLVSNNLSQTVASTIHSRKD